MSLLACFLTILTSGGIVIFGTINMYLASFLLHYDQTINLDLLFSLFPISLITEAVGGAIASKLYHCVGPKIISLAGGVTFSYAINYMSNS